MAVVSGGDQAYLASQPIGQLPLDERTLRQLRMLGVATIGAFGDLPPLAWTGHAGIGVWSWFLYIAVAVSGASFFLQNYALRHLPVGRVTLYSVLSAPIGVPFAWLVLGESISARDMIAIAIVVAGVALPALTRAGFRVSIRP